MLLESNIAKSLIENITICDSITSLFSLYLYVNDINISIFIF